MKVIKGALPSSDRAYYQLKRGHLEWPPASRIYEFFGTMVRGWKAAGANKRRLKVGATRWSPAEHEYLLKRAGIDTLAQIAAHLGRSYQATRVQIGSKGWGMTARGAQGDFSAAEIAQEFGCSYHRVRRLLIDERIPGRYDRVRNRWRVFPDKLTAEQRALLDAPKRTHKSRPTDLGDWASRNHLYRKTLGGKVFYVKEPA